ncbi:excinuclease ABC subunit UvrA [Patescibacteria group bacterium]|nr:excinuclease ABC subunit UvrA [Patescibacteria group bacterium]
MKNNSKISIKGARVNNLKNINVEIPKNKFVVITGISGSGKSSLAFDTIYAEGQRRYVESLSSYARQFLGPQDKPDVDSIIGLSPAIAIDQKKSSHNPRSTVGTMTEIYDFLRLLFARVGRARCPNCQTQVAKQTSEQIIEKIIDFGQNNKILIISPLIKKKKSGYKKVLQEIIKADFDSIRLDNEFYPVQEALQIELDKDKEYNLDVVVGSFDKNCPDLASEKKISAMVNIALDLSNGLVVVYNTENNPPAGEKEILFSENLTCPKCDFSLPEIEPRLFSFNSPYGACSTCSGLGVKQEIDAELVIPNKKLTASQGAIRPWTRTGARSMDSLLAKIQKSGQANGFSINTPIKDFNKKQLDVLLYGDKYFEGVIPNLKQKYLESNSDYVKSEIEKYMRPTTCDKCKGKKLNPVALSVTVAGKNIVEVSDITISECLKFFSNLKNLSSQEKQIASQITREISDRLKSLKDVGLGYLNLNRGAQTLSGGEAQRIRLATQIGAGLSNVIYVLDEPSIGLHQKDNEHLIKTLKNLRDLENSVIVVEHDEQTMLSADYLIDVGPGAGKYGGEIIAQGTPAEIKKNKNSLTGQYLSGQKIVEMRPYNLSKKQRDSDKSLTIKKANAFNLKNIDVKIPLGKLVAITGVSGSGKSTLMTEILAKALARHFHHAKDLPGAHKEISGLENIDKVISIDQSPIGRTPRSNPATYTGVFTTIRELFTNTSEAKIKRLGPGNFSFNVKGGRCEDCQGDGLIKIEMNFLSDVYVKCSTCHGKRFKPEILDIHYKNKNISDVLEMTVEEALEFFKDQSHIKNKLNILNDVGLGYIQLGQSATTLSGGEAQRVKLATELARRATGKTLYILDEPTTGLHFDDINKLLKVLYKLVSKGNSVLIIEHNLDVIKNVDWIIDLGPEGGDKGGYLVAEGTPQDVAKIKKSWTGKYLKNVLN